MPSGRTKAAITTTLVAAAALGVMFSTSPAEASGSRVTITCRMAEMNADHYYSVWQATLTEDAWWDWADAYHFRNFICNY
ncbi:hypothetical protein GCM10009422_20160 [Brevundimonas kwangchunensis]|uniref:Ig-like domain-containing protein n=1 Tax=Brevundimonas kwangchunensis TaxID=322163 RepID=A0ABN1GYT8_9CAUL